MRISIISKVQSKIIQKRRMQFTLNQFLAYFSPSILCEIFLF